MEFSEQQPHIQESSHFPIEEMEDSILYLGIKLAKAKDSSGGFVPERDKLESFYVNDKYALELQQKIAIAMGLGQNLLIEGGTAIGKTTTVAKMCAELGYELHYVNLNAQTDVENMMGRYIPNIRREKETDPEYEFADGSVTSGLRPEEGKVKVIVLDEVNATHPGTLKRLNEVLNAVEQGGTVVLTEDAAEQIRVSKETTKVIALMNPSGQGYLGVNPLSKELINRFVYQKEVNELPRESFGFRRKARRGIGDKTQEMPVSSFIPTLDNALSMEQYNEIAGIDEIEAKYEEFHFSAKKLLEVKKLAEDQIQLFLYDDQRESDRVTDFVLRHYNGDINETFQQALRYYYANKLESEIDRKKIDELIKLVEYTPKVVKSKRRGSERGETVISQPAQEIIDNGENFWPFETLTQEKVKEQFQQQIDMYRELGILTKLSTNQEGIIDIKGKERQAPTIEQVINLLQEKQEILKPKIEQGFTEFLIVPDTYSLDQFIDQTKQNILTHHQANKLFVTKKDQNDPNEPLVPLELDESEPLWVWDKYQNADKSGELVYYPTKYSTNHGGKTKSQLILEEKRAIPGWKILLIENLPNIPRAGQGQTIESRPQFEANKTPTEYLQEQQTNPIYQNEVFFTPEDWLAYFNYHLKVTDQVIDDYQGFGSIRYLGAAYFSGSGYVSNGYWHRDYKQALLRRRDPGYRLEHCGSAAAVRVN